MANETKKKEASMAGSIILLIIGILIVIFGGDYLWVLFDTIEIPLQIVGAVFAILGGFSLIGDIKKKKK